MKKHLKKLISALLCLTLSVSVFACSDGNGDETTTEGAESTTTEAHNDQTSLPDDTTTSGDAGVETPEKVDLNGKKILIIGNSYVYYGRSVIHKGTSVKDQASRSNDKGFFYQLCKLNGYDVSVTNWTFGGHGLGDFCDKPCSRGDCPNTIHQNYLTHQKHQKHHLPYC